MQRLKDTISSKGTKAEKRKKRTTVFLKDLLRMNELCNTVEYIWVKVNEGTNKSNTAIIYSSTPNQEEDMDEAFPKQIGKSCL